MVRKFEKKLKNAKKVGLINGEKVGLKLFANLPMTKRAVGRSTSTTAAQSRTPTTAAPSRTPTPVSRTTTTSTAFRKKGIRQVNVKQHWFLANLWSITTMVPIIATKLRDCGFDSSCHKFPVHQNQMNALAFRKRIEWGYTDGAITDY